ncbi:MAG: ABC transporter substrate-binding protein [Huintestinicola sp.]|uniref:ABC transporter substrate-binding protein n=1 Tax=Huintestinicola sp. TaxID=2981661 RepID=UPI003F095A83
MNLHKLAALSAAFVLMTACGSSASTSDTQETAPSDTSAVSDSVTAAEGSEVSESEAAPETEETPETTAILTEGMEYNISSLKGPTTMGMVKLMSDSEKGETVNKYNVTIHGTADEIVTGIVSGNTDIANVPANLAAVLYNKTEGNIKTAAVNTLGVLYVVSSGEEISSVADLKGKTVYSTGKGTTPEYVLNYILRQNGLEPQTDVIIEYKSEASECAAVMAESENAIAVLPQPYVTAAQLQNENIKISLSLTDEWDKVSETPLITGVTIAQKSVIEENEAAFADFIGEYQASVDFVNENTDEAAELIGNYDIVKAPVAKKALPYCNITLLRGEDMRSAVTGYWNILFDADPKSVGGKLPDDDAFYTEMIYE